ncbi:unnamed protein product [Rhizoctonia solani]|uniref:NADPH-dependent diflavin oxidoreductase 1 n=1 Tax=Rhizoctonia solani TaxID=456999 RepID=A0A8H3DRN6_9AGAM|nr:unnamed protein product [Rhizoctonia solani]
MLMSDRSILILYGTETGNAKDASEKIGRVARRYHFSARVVAMDAFSVPTLIDEPLVVFVCSTTGNGVEPANMTALWNALLRAELPSDLFEDMEFAVLGLGDSSYQRFNWAAKRLQRRLLSLGGRELCERGEADDQHPQGSDGVIDPWIATLFDQLSERYPVPLGLDVLPDTDLYAPMIKIIPWANETSHSLGTLEQVPPQPLHTMTLIRNTRITEPKWYQDVRHIILKTDEEIRYEPGDVAVLQSENLPDDVDILLKRLGWESEADIPIRVTPSSSDRSLPLGYPGPDSPTTLRFLITKYADINSVPRKSFIELLAHFTKDQMETDKLREFCTGEGLDELFDYTTRVRRTILEVLLEFRSVVVPKDYIADLFPELRPRQFSIASSLSAHPSEVHLCVAIVNYRTKLRVPRKGVCTSWLARLEPGAILRVGLKRGTMHLPKDQQKPIILVGPGTGVAPMRAMIEERVAQSATDNTLYFGCRSIGSDYHFRTEWEAYRERGSLIHRVAASRDQDKKVYVQDLMTLDSREIKQRIVDHRGILYLSGSSNQMPAGVRRTVTACLRDECGWSDDQSASYVNQMEMEGRWCEECCLLAIYQNVGFRGAQRHKVIRSTPVAFEFLVCNLISNPFNPVIGEMTFRSPSSCDWALDRAANHIDGNAMVNNPVAEDVESLVNHANISTQYIPVVLGCFRQDKIEEIEGKIRAIEQRRASSSPATSQTRSISYPPGSSPASTQTYGSPVSNDSGELRSPPPIAFVPDSVSRLLESDFSFYPQAGCPWIEAAISVRLASEGLDIRPDLLRCMLAIFVQRRGLSGHKLHMGRVLRNLSASEKPVLALLYAILLTACHFAQDSEFKSWEPALLERTKSEIEANIVPAHEFGHRRYNSLHHLQAMLILSQYYYFKSRMLEGHVQTNITTQFAIAMGIHRLNSRMIDHYTVGAPNSVLSRERWRPRDSIELGEAINLLWGCVARDLVGGIMNGLPPSLPPEEITAVWPIPLAAFVENSDLPYDNYSVRELLDSESSGMVADVSQDSAACLLIKSLILVHYAGKFDTERISRPELTNEWWAQFEDCDRAIQRFVETIPRFDAGRNPEEVSHLVLAHTAIDCATLQLHGALAEHELILSIQGGSYQSDGSPGGRSYARCAAACRNVASVTAYIEGMDLSYMHMFIAVTWMCAGSVLAKHIPILRESSYTEQLQSMGHDMMIIDRNMECFLNTYPIFHPQVAQLRAMRGW